MASGEVCLVCHSDAREEPLSVHSGVAPLEGSIGGQMGRVVGREEVLEACRTSEVVCPSCLRLLLSIVDLEVKLGFLKEDFRGTFQRGAELRRGQGEGGKGAEGVKGGGDGGAEGSGGWRDSGTEGGGVKGGWSNDGIGGDGVDGGWSNGRAEGSKGWSNDGPEGNGDNAEWSADGTEGDKGNAGWSADATEGIKYTIIDKGEWSNDTEGNEEDNGGWSNAGTEDNGDNGGRSDTVTEGSRNNDNVENGDKSATNQEHQNGRNLAKAPEETSRANESTELTESKGVIGAEGEGDPLPGVDSCKAASGRRTRSSASRNMGCARQRRSKRKRAGGAAEDIRLEANSEKEIGLEDWLQMEDESTQSSAKGVTCDLCGERFRDARLLGRHRGVSHPSVYRYACERCQDVRYREKSKLTQHLSRIHKVQVHRCRGCDHEASSQNSLDQHIIREHPASRYFECPMCPKAFRTHRYLNFVHVKRCHLGLPVRYECAQCGRGFVDKSSYENHRLTHSEARAHACGFCGAAFRTPYALGVHVNTHTRQREYPCRDCGARFLRPCNLSAHRGRFHGPEDARLVCDRCGGRAATRRDLRRHQESHHHPGGKPAPRDAPRRQRRGRAEEPGDERMVVITLKECDPRVYVEDAPLDYQAPGGEGLLGGLPALLTTLDAPGQDDVVTPDPLQGETPQTQLIQLPALQATDGTAPVAFVTTWPFNSS